MTDPEEKLVELLKEIGMLEIEDILYTAEYLIAHGVTVKGKHKPLTLEAAIEAKYVCIEQREIGCPEFVKLYRHSIYKNCVQVFMIGCLYPWNYFIESYGKEWRCWAEKPTEEERKAAEWEK